MPHVKPDLLYLMPLRFEADVDIGAVVREAEGFEAL